MKLLIAGDLVIDELSSFSGLNPGIVKLFNDSDLNIVNLEAPVTPSLSKITKTGPHLKANKDNTSNMLKALSVNIVTLANNHILDYGEQGLSDTLAYCKEQSIKTVGAGMNLREASKTLYIDTKEGKVAFVNFAENEWANATKASAGANPMDIIDNTKQIKNAKESADFVFVIIHGGNEYNHYPSPRMVKQYRFYAENGADAVIGHHTHCVSGFENHKGVPIFYSLGNFLFTTKKKKLDSWYSGLVLQFDIQQGKGLQFETIAVSQEKDSHKLSLTDRKGEDKVLTMINEINKVISDEKQLEEKWQEFVETVQRGFVQTITPLAGIQNKYIKAVLYRLNLYKLFLHKAYLKENLNRIRCESHLDVTVQLLQNFLKNTLKR